MCRSRCSTAPALEAGHHACTDSSPAPDRCSLLVPLCRSLMWMVAISQEHSNPGLQPASLASMNWTSASMRSALACRVALHLQWRCHACHVGAWAVLALSAMAQKAMPVLGKACLVMLQTRHNKVSCLPAADRDTACLVGHHECHSARGGREQGGASLLCSLHVSLLLPAFCTCTH